jgi:hypothetical protein
MVIVNLATYKLKFRSIVISNRNNKSHFQGTKPKKKNRIVLGDETSLAHTLPEGKYTPDQVKKILAAKKEASGSGSEKADDWNQGGKGMNYYLMNNL